MASFLENLFYQASRNKMRWESTRGLLTVEDLWDLSLEELNEIAKDLFKKVNTGAEINFIKKEETVDKLAEAKFEIARVVIDVKLREADERQNAEVRRQKKQKIMELIARKEEEDLGKLDTDELRDMLAAL